MTASTRPFASSSTTPPSGWAICSSRRPESPDFHLFAKPPQRPRTHHLHICEVKSEHEFRQVAVRDFLRAHSDEAATYAALKGQVVARHPQNRLAYIEGKQDYIADLQARAVEWARGRS